jgi:hypothetical protein
MDKKTQMYLGIAVVVGLGYYLYKTYSKPSGGFKNFRASSDLGVVYDAPPKMKCQNGHTEVSTLSDGTKVYKCCDGNWAWESAGGQCKNGKQSLPQ